MQLFGELDYVREANNCERFRELYGGWKNVMVPDVCTALTRKKVLVMEWVDGQKGPWPGDDGIKMVRIGLKCSVDQLVSVTFNTECLGPIGVVDSVLTFLSSWIR
jgi:aarF domain-containing kinase